MLYYMHVFLLILTNAAICILSIVRFRCCELNKQAISSAINGREQG